MLESLPAGFVPGYRAFACQREPALAEDLFAGLVPLVCARAHDDFSCLAADQCQRIARGCREDLCHHVCCYDDHCHGFRHDHETSRLVHDLSDGVSSGEDRQVQ